MTNVEKRIDLLKEAGMDTTKFFNLNMRIPAGVNVEIKIDGVPYDFSGVEDNPVENDQIAKEILDGGYIFNSRTDGRWVCAQTFKMLDGKAFNYKTGIYEYGWDACLRLNYPYMYQFTMMEDELCRLAKMEQKDDPEFKKLSRFFTKEVVYETCRHYIKQLKKFIKAQPVRHCKGVPYVKLQKYGNVYHHDLNSRVYGRLNFCLLKIERCTNYAELEIALKSFVNQMAKLPTNTPKCSAWKDAFKGKGGYLTLMNIVKFHNCVVQNYETKEMLNKYESVDYIESLLDKYDGAYWKFHELLKATIDLNNFSLKGSLGR